MNKKLIIISGLVILVLFLGFKALSGSQKVKSSSTENSSQPVPTQLQEKNNPPAVVQKAEPADKIEVVHFHGTHQCWSCITVGEYALSTIKEKFPDEYRSGKIVFQDINGELPENREIVNKYQARGSSLFINAISNGQDNIKEDTRVWYLVTDKNKFTEYFESKLKTLLGM